PNSLFALLQGLLLRGNDDQRVGAGLGRQVPRELDAGRPGPPLILSTLELRAHEIRPPLLRWDRFGCADENLQAIQIRESLKLTNRGAHQRLERARDRSRVSGQ